MGSKTIVARIVATFSLLLCAAAAGQGTGSARPYPEKPVRLVSPSGTGSGNDLLARVLAKKLSEQFGQQVIVDNRPGASGILGGELVAKSPADGYTIMLGFNGNLVAVAALYKKLPYETLRDFAPVLLVATIPGMLAVHPSVPARSVKGLIALAVGKPGELNYCSYGAGSGSFMAMELLKSMAKVNIVNVSYKSSTQAVVDLIGGQVHMMLHSAPIVYPHATAGKLRALGVSSATRWVSAPDLPTIAEAAVPGYELSVWFGLVAPAKTDREIVHRLNREVITALKAPDVRQALLSQGFDLGEGTSEQFGSYIRSELERYVKIAAAAGMQPE